MLNGKLGPLWDIDDAEVFTLNVYNKVLRSRNAHLNGDGEDLLADMLGALWRLSGLDANLKPLKPRPEHAYNPEVGTTFSGWAGQRLGWLVIHYLRRQIGRYQPYPEIVPLESELGSPLGPGSLDPAPHSSTDLAGVLARGDSSQAWAASPLCDERPRRTTRRAA